MGLAWGWVLPPDTVGWFLLGVVFAAGGVAGWFGCRWHARRQMRRTYARIEARFEDGLNHLKFKGGKAND